MTSRDAQLELFDQLSPYEGVDVEYKGAKGGLPRSLWETYSAFANTAGGTIWLGITERDGLLDPHGVEGVAKLLGDFWNTVNNRGKVSTNLLVDADVETVPIPGAGRVAIAIKIPRADRRQRPVYIDGNPLGGTYRRNSEGDYRCSDDEVRRMFADQSDEPADSRILAGFGLSDFHAETVRRFRNRFRSWKPDHAWLAENDEELLTKLGALRTDRPSGRRVATVAGLLMFGKAEAIVLPDAVPGFHVDYRERFSDDANIRWTDRLVPDGTWEANVFQFYEQVILKLSTGPGIKHPFQRDAEGYRRQTSAVHEALQEALVNSLIHADYAGQGGIVIDRYLDRIEFSNPGTLLVSRQQLLRGGISECRNKSLQRMFQMLGVGDKAGSGIDKIRRSWEAQHWQSPRLLETQRPDRVRLILPMVSTLPEAVIDGLRSRFGDSYEELGPEEVQALVTAEVEGAVTNQRLQEMVVLHRADITVLLRGLVRRGLLVSDGVGRGTRYLPARAGLGPSEPSSDQPRSDPGSRSGDRHPSLGGSDGRLGDNDARLGDDAPRLGAMRTAPEVTEAVLAELHASVEPLRSRRRVPPDTMRTEILRLTTHRFLTVQQLVALLGRRADTLQKGYLAPLVDAGALRLRYPDRPNHPEQAYTAILGAKE